MGTTIHRAIHHLRHDSQSVRFANHNKATQFYSDDIAVMVSYDSGVDGHYCNKKDIKKAGLPIILNSMKRVSVANREASTGEFVTKLPFQQLSHQAATADTF